MDAALEPSSRGRLPRARMALPFRLDPASPDRAAERRRGVRGDHSEGLEMLRQWSLGAVARAGPLTADRLERDEAVESIRPESAPRTVRRGAAAAAAQAPVGVLERVVWEQEGAGSRPSLDATA